MAKPSEGKHENLFIVVNYYNRYCKIQICLLFGSITLGKRKSRSEENDDEVDLLEGSCGVSSRVFCSAKERKHQLLPVSKMAVRSLVLMACLHGVFLRKM